MSRELTVTVKYGKGYEESWAVFRGVNDEVRQDILDYFGMDADENAKLTLSELVVNATSLAHGKMLAVTALGGTVTPSPEATAAPAKKAPAKRAPAKKAAPAAAPDEAQTAGDAWSEAESGEDAPDPLFATIEAATDVKGLQQLYADNAAALGGSADLLAAWKAKGKALTTAA